MNRAFTLAEVLITLGIIGVVAALTIPQLVANHKAKALEVALKKNASIIQQALDLANEANGETITPTNSSPRKFKNLIKPYLNVLKDCGYGTEVGSCVLNSTDKAPGIYKTYNKNREAYYPFLDDGQLLLNDGSLILIDNINASQLFISVDVNGYQKKPNLWGHDLFTFEIDETGKLLPMGANGTSYSSPNNCNKASNDTGILNGVACTQQALTDPNYFKNLP